MSYKDSYIEQIISQIEKDSLDKNLDYFCSTRDIFQARIDSYALSSGKYLESAVIGEIGNNTFDHNWDFMPNHMRGAYFNLETFDNTVVLADFGRGIRESLKNVYTAKNDVDAVTVAFTKHLSGRAPEQRGNGLKFVADSVKKKHWSMYFQSWNGCCIIENGEISFSSCNFTFLGCLAVLSF